MKFFVAVAFAVIAAAVADVSHLGNTYLPPHHDSASYNSNSYSQPGASYLAPAATQTYSSGADHSTYGSTNSGAHAYKATTYTGSAGSHGNYGAPSVSYRSSAPAVSRSYLAPAASQTYSSHGAPSTYGSAYTGAQSYRSHSRSAYSAPSTASYTQTRYEAEPRYTHQTYNAPSAGSAGTQYASNGGYAYGKRH